jgi:starch synthase
MPEPSPPAIYFARFETKPETIYGLQVANRGFLQGLIRYGGLMTLYGYMPQQARSGTLFEQVARDLGAAMPVRIIESHRLDQLAEVGNLTILDPRLAKFARQRSFARHRDYALTGLTHSLTGAESMIADLVTAPVQSWDALVCTSRVAAAMVDEILQAEEAKLAERLGATRFPRALLPVIPLGIDAARFMRQEEWRASWRERLGIGTQEVAALYIGRLSRHEKAHPLPMLAALGRAARLQPQPLHLILAGRWQHSREEAVWRDQAAVLCPEVRLHVVGSLAPGDALHREIWSAADIFTMLVDNTQETFGLAVVEAMAAGLPVVATDWNGFRDTVRHGVDGILVPTLMAPPGEEGLVAAIHYATCNINYHAWLALTARLTAVDIGAATEAFRVLAADPALRQRMGAAGQARVREAFDWAAIIPQYQALWREQEAIRLAAPATGVPVPDPRHMDPTQAYAAWPSGTFHSSQRLRPDPAAASADLPTLLRFTAPALSSDLGETKISGLLAELYRRGEATARELLEVLEPAQRDAGPRALLWLLRVGLVAAV